MKNKSLLTHFFFIALFLWGSVEKGFSQAPPGYQLVWSDEFNSASIDPSNWGFDIGGSGWGNNELQYYTNRPENAYLSNGQLVIEARQESYNGNNYTSARLLTKGKREFLFGRIDIRAKLPKGQGIWPALWSLGKNIDQVGWPACGEMDIMELLGNEPNKMYSTVHWAPPGGGSTNLSRNYTLPSGDFSEDFHIFSMVWATDLIKFYVDDNLVSTVARTDISGNYPFNNPFFLIFNVAVGGNWPGNPDGTTAFPQRMYVDYVRVYQENSTLVAPTTAAPTPTQQAANVISLFSNAYTNVPVDTWSASWDVADVEDVSIAGNAAKKYSNLTYAGVEFHTPGPTINATDMVRFHADVWTPDAGTFKIKLVDFGADGAYGGNDDTEHELAFTPTLGNWYSIDVPLSDFTGMTSRAHVAQLIFSNPDGSKTAWVDNVYFYKLPPTEPTVAAPTPTPLPENVISLYSNAYTNVPVDTWSTSWDVTDLEDVSIAGNATKKYSNLTFAGVEFINPGPQINATAMERFHVDLWTPDAGIFKVKLVDFGADGAYQGGDDTEHELSFTPTLSDWYSIDVPLSDFTNLTSRGHLSQLILVGEGGGKTAWIDNVYFYRSAGTVGPVVAAPTPTPLPENVISLFSNAYTNVPVDTWSTSWDVADLEDVSIAGNATKKYSNFSYAGVEFTNPGPQINATAMERFHADVWTSDASAFRVKLVDFGADGAYGGNDDTEHELSFTPTLGNWYSIDVPLSSFTGMTSRAHVAQLIFSSPQGGKTVWVDNVYFYKSPASEPTVAAPTPTPLPENVISLYSNAYTNVPVDTWSTSWDVTDLEDVSIAGNATKKYSNFSYAGVEFTNPGPQINATAMERFHADVWTSDASAFRVKLVDFGADGAYGGNDDTEHELSFTPTLGGWYSIDVPLSSFTGLASRAHLAQLIFSSPQGGKTVWVDNVFFYKVPPPSASISGSAAVCQNAESPQITFTGSNGQAPYTFSYTLNGVPGTVTTPPGSNSVQIPQSTSVPNTFVYTLLSVKDATERQVTQSQSVTIVIKPTPTSALAASQTDVCPNTQVTLDAHCSIATATVNWNPGAPTVIPNAATTPYIYKASCTADGCTGSETSAEIRTQRILVDLKEIGTGTLPQPIVRAVKDNLEPTNMIAEPISPRRWTVIAKGCDVSESAVFKLTGPVNFSSIDNGPPFAMFANLGETFFSIDHPNYGNGGSFPDGTYNLTVELRSMDGVGAPFPKNRVAKGNLLASRMLQFTVNRQQSIVGSRQGQEGNVPLPMINDQWALIAPNPVSQTMRVWINEAKGQKVSAALFDASGRVLLQRGFVPETEAHAEEFDVRSLNEGLYFLKVNAGDRQQTLKVIKVE